MGSSDNYKADRLITLSVYLSVSIKCGHNEMDLYILHMYIYLVVPSLSVITSSQGKYPGELLERRHMYTETGARGVGSRDNYKADRLITMSVYLSVPIKCGHNEMDLYVFHMYIYLLVPSLLVLTSSQDK